MARDTHTRRRRIVLGALICALIAAGLVYAVRVFFPELLERSGEGGAFAAGYFAVVILVPLIAMFTLASLVLATLGALAREKGVTFLTLVVIVLTWTFVSPTPVQVLAIELAASPEGHTMAILVLAAGLLIFLVPVFFLMLLGGRRN